MSRRAKRAIARQLAYQSAKARALPPDVAPLERELTEYAGWIKARVEAHRPIPKGARILEVGSGAHGLVFFIGLPNAIGVDPLASEYRRLFPQWQARAKTFDAFGESLPFADGSFDFVFSDNVVDHAESPKRIVEEIARVLVPGGLLYFTVNVHHRIYGAASRLYALWQMIAPRYEIAAFADHTVHLTPRDARALVDPDKWTVLHDEADIEETRKRARVDRPRHLGDRVKRLFFKNARLEIIAERR